jgi:hypothetical protein
MSQDDWGKDHPQIDRLRESVDGARQAVVGHPVYRRLTPLLDVNTFTEHHVFAV